jgi:hypothetical protein
MFSWFAYVHVPNEKRTKLDLKVKKCIFIGYSLEQKGCRCFNLSIQKLQMNKDVFNEMVNEYSLMNFTNLLGFLGSYKFHAKFDFHRLVQKSHEFHIMIKMEDIYIYSIS